MTGRDPLVERAARLLREDGVSEGVGPARSDAIALMIAARDDQVRRRRLARGAAVFAAAAAVALGVIGVRRAAPEPPAVAAAAPSTSVSANAEGPIVHSLGGDAMVFRAGKEVPLIGRMTAEPGDRVITAADGRAGVTLTTGTQLLVDKGGDVALLGTSSTQVLFLAAGSMRADVAKLTEGERFLVRTADAEVEVKGTSFRVERVAACAGSSTTVVVFEGVVSVRAAGHEVRLVAGDRWPSGCFAGSVAAQPTATSQQANAKSSAPSVIAATSASAAAAIKSSLAEQNDLYAAAIGAKKRGDGPTAVGKFDELLWKYPGSALAEQAYAERFKTLAGFDAGRARAAASAYLAKYPTGFARADAQAIVEKKP